MINTRILTKTYSNLLLKCKLSDLEINTAINSDFSTSTINTLTDRQLKDILPDLYRQTKYHLHGRTRKKMRGNLSIYLQQRQDYFTAGKIGKVITSILGSKKMHCDLNYITLPDNTVVHNPKCIHDEITQSFHRWFEVNESNSGGSDKFVWSNIQNSTRLMKEYGLSLNIPEELVDNLIDAFISKSESRTVVAEVLTNSLASPPTFEEFEYAIKISPQESAGGVTGITYAMIKGWNKEIRTKVHYLLSKLWNNLHTPEWFKHKILQPIGKASSPDTSILANLRPLMLIEPLRKLWVSITIKRIRHTWEDHNMLDGSQYGFRHNRSCGPAIMQLINSLETAEEECSNIYISSWDVSKAFDSISRPFIHMSLERLGVPDHIASWFSMMDDNDHVTVRTPYSSSRKNTRHFSTGQGTGQGDISSPDIWNAFMDILLTLLKNYSNPDFLIKTDCNTLATQHDTAYADDLFSVGATKATLQKKADLVSTFAVFFGLKINHSKLRAFMIIWGREYNEDQNNPSITIHTANWTPVVIELKEHGSLTYLGSLIDLNNKSEKEKVKIRELVEAASSVIRRKTASSAIKMMVVKISLIPKALYCGTFASWSFAEYEMITGIISSLIKSILLLDPSHPTILLYASTKSSGLGLPNYTAMSQLCKLRLILRILYGKDKAAQNAINSLILRAARLSHDDIPNENSICITSTISHLEMSSTWVTSLLEYLRSGEITLAKTIHQQCTSLDLPLKAINFGKNNSAQLKELMRNTGIRTIGEILTLGTNKQLTLCPSPLITYTVPSNLYPLNPEHITLRSGQCMNSWV